MGCCGVPLERALWAAAEFVVVSELVPADSIDLIRVFFGVAGLLGFLDTADWDTLLVLWVALLIEVVVCCFGGGICSQV